MNTITPPSFPPPHMMNENQHQVEKVLSDITIPVEEARQFFSQELLKESFKLGKVSITSPNALIGLLKAIKNPTEIDLTNTTFSDEAWHALIDNLTSDTPVLSLLFGVLSAERISSLDSIDATFLSRLQTLHLEGRKEPVDFRFLGKTSALTSLALDGMAIDDTQFFELLPLINKLPLLRLSLANNKLTSKSLAVLPNLRELFLQHNCIELTTPQFTSYVLHSDLVHLKIHNNLLSEAYFTIFILTLAFPSNNKIMRIDLFPQEAEITKYTYHETGRRMKHFGIANNIPFDENAIIPRPQLNIETVIKEVNVFLGNLNFLEIWNAVLEGTLSTQFRVEDVPGDGDCLFEAVGRHLNMPNYIVRSLVVNHERKNRDNYALFYGEDNFDNHLSQIARPGYWGGQLEIAAMHELFHRPIIIFHPRNQLRISEGKILPPEMYIQGELKSDSNPIFLFNMIYPVANGEFPYDELHYKALFPLDREREAVCQWPAQFEKAPEGDTWGKFFADPSVSYEQGIIRLWNLKRPDGIFLEDVRIDSLNSLKVFCDFLGPKGVCVDKLSLSRVQFSDECFNYFLAAINQMKSIRVLCLPDFDLPKLAALVQEGKEFFANLKELDLSGKPVSPELFLPILKKLPRLEKLDLTGLRLGNRVFECAEQLRQMDKVVLVWNEITDLSGCPFFPAHLDLSKNLIPAEKMVQFLEALKEPMITDTLVNFLPQNILYAPNDFTRVASLLSLLDITHFYGIRDSISNLLSLIELCDGVDDVLIDKVFEEAEQKYHPAFRIHLLKKQFRFYPVGKNVWPFLSRVFKEREKDLQTEIAAFIVQHPDLFGNSVQILNDLPLRPENHIEMLMQIMCTIQEKQYYLFTFENNLIKIPENGVCLYRDKNNVTYFLIKKYTSSPQAREETEEKKNQENDKQDLGNPSGIGSDTTETK